MKISVNSFNYLSCLCFTATPKAPFPTIQECQELLYTSGSLDTDDTCILGTESAINITCSVYEFFPNINLYFLHYSAKVEAVETREVINADGTKNKSVTITAVPSIDPYVCVASDILGFGEEEEKASIIIHIPSALITSTNGGPLTMSTEGSPDGVDITGKGISRNNDIILKIRHIDKSLSYTLRSRQGLKKKSYKKSHCMCHNL